MRAAVERIAERGGGNVYDDLAIEREYAICLMRSTDCRSAKWFMAQAI